MPKKNCSIDIFRYISALMVMSIHIHPFSDVSKFWGWEFKKAVPRIGVPFFFCVAGYFYIRKLSKGKKAFFPYLKRILTIYLFWSCLYYLIDFFEWGKSDIKGYVHYCIHRFFVEGSHFHFWFFPALIVSVIFVTVLFSLKLQSLILPVSIALYVIGCLSGPYYALGSRIPFIESLCARENYNLIRRIYLMGIPCFSAGFLVAMISDSAWYKKIKNIPMLLALALSVVLWRAEIYFVIANKLRKSIIITPALYLMLILLMLVLLRFPMYKCKKQAEFCKVAAGFTYYIHPMFIWMIDKVSDRYGFVVTETPRYALIWAATAFLAWCIYRSDIKPLKMICS